MPRPTFLSGITYPEAVLLFYAAVYGPIAVLVNHLDNWRIPYTLGYGLFLWTFIIGIVVVPVCALIWIGNQIFKHLSRGAITRVAGYVALATVSWLIPLETPADRLWREHEASLRKQAADAIQSGRLSHAPLKWQPGSEWELSFTCSENDRFTVVYLPDDQPHRHEIAGSSLENVMVRHLAPHWYVFQLCSTL